MLDYVQLYQRKLYHPNILLLDNYIDHQINHMDNHNQYQHYMNIVNLNYHHNFIFNENEDDLIKKEN